MAVYVTSMTLEDVCICTYATMCVSVGIWWFNVSLTQKLRPKSLAHFPPAVCMAQCDLQEQSVMAANSGNNSMSSTFLGRQRYLGFDLSFFHRTCRRTLSPCPSVRIIAAACSISDSSQCYGYEKASVNAPQPQSSWFLHVFTVQLDSTYGSYGQSPVTRFTRRLVLANGWSVPRWKRQLLQWGHLQRTIN